MVTDLAMATIEIAVSASDASNDHEARVRIDGLDLLQSLGLIEELGLDPPELVQALRQSPPSALIFGRCSCGCVGCGDIIATVEDAAETVVWRVKDRQIVFGKAQYAAEIARFVNDESWRPLDRLVELRVGEVFEGLRLENSLDFCWASARITPNVIHLLFDRRATADAGGEQRLLEFNWNGETLESAVDRALTFRAERFDG